MTREPDFFQYTLKDADDVLLGNIYRWCRQHIAPDGWRDHNNDLYWELKHIRSNMVFQTRSSEIYTRFVLTWG